MVMGKEGYYERNTSQKKIVEQAATIYEGEMELNKDAANSMFDMALRTTQAAQPSTTDVFDAATLPFFNMSRIRMPRALPMDGNGHTSAAESSSEHHVAREEQSVEKDLKSDEKSNSDSEDRECQDGLQVSLLFASSAAKAKAASKSAPKAKVKSQPKPTENAEGRGKRRKKSDTVEELELPEAPVKPPRFESSEENDKKTIDSFKELLAGHQKSSFIIESTTDTQLSEGLKASSKSLTTTKNSCAQKAKSLGRRKDGTSDFVVSELSAIQSELERAIKVCSGLVSQSSDDCSLVDSMEALASWKFAPSLWKRGLKCACVSNLKFTDWASFTGITRTRMFKVLGKDEGAKYFLMMLNEITQKLLRSIPLKKATR